MRLKYVAIVSFLIPPDLNFLPTPWGIPIILSWQEGPRGGGRRRLGPKSPFLSQAHPSGYLPTSVGRMGEGPRVFEESLSWEKPGGWGTDVPPSHTHTSLLLPVTL